MLGSPPFLLDARAESTSRMTIAHLRCEYLVNPLGIDVPQPRLSWVLVSKERSQRQTAYQILVASDEKALANAQGDLWDSGKVASDQAAHVVYGGQPLTSRQRCYWKVRAWDREGRPTKWSEPASWSMGLLKASDWQAQWLGYFDPTQRDAELGTAGQLDFAGCRWIWYPEGNPLQNAPAGKRFLRHAFDLPGEMPIQRGRLLLTVDDRYVVFLNGRQVRKSYEHGNSWMRAYETDVAGFLQAGRNVLAIEAGSSGNGPAGAIAKLAVELTGGQRIEVRSDAAWKAGTNEVAAWNSLACDDSDWNNALVLGEVGIKPWGNHWTGWAQQAPSPILRKAFTLSKPVRSAMLYATGLGYQELRLNGRKVGDHVLDPAFTRYDRRVFYITHDVTRQVRRGDNALGVMLGNGWYHVENFEEWDFLKAPWRDRPKALMQLEVTYKDGSTEVIASDTSWRAATGPVRFDGIRNGEVYDARLDRAGWDQPRYDDSKWSPAQVLKAPEGTLRAQMLPPIRVTEILRPVKLTEPKPGVFVFDLGQNIAGWARLQVSGPADTRVTMRYGEKLTADGLLDQYPIDCFVYQGPFQTDVYILKGQGEETWEPRFSYHGFQYVEVTGFPGQPSLESLRGHVVHTDFRSVGAFECSDPMLNRIHHLARWSFRGNFHGYPTDCPQREKNGWAGDAHVFAEAALLNFEATAALEKWLGDFRDERRPDGQAAAIIPTSGWGYNLGPSWDSACVLIPWYLHVYSGDTRVLSENYDQMKHYVDFLGTKAKDHIVSYGLGDWMFPKTATPAEVTSTAYFYVDSIILAKAAALLGKDDDARKYADQATRIHAAFNARLYKGQGTYANGSQTAQSCPLYQGLVPEAEREATVRQLEAAVAARDHHVDVGIIGIKYLFNALSQAGRDDLAYRIVTQTDAPGWGDWLNRGATTCWEDWPGEFSHNHYAFGTVDEWFYKALAGIRPDPERPGFRHFFVHPRPVGGLTWVRAGFESVRGRIASEWRIERGRFLLNVTVPANATATVYVPTRQPAQITESGKPVRKAPGVRFMAIDAGCAVFELNSGRFAFAAPYATDRKR